MKENEHQIKTPKHLLTTNSGAPIENNQASLTVGEDGPVLLQDLTLIEKISHFDRERIPERVVHANGAGAHGYFKVYKDMSKYTKAKFLSDPEIKTPVFVRFSTVVGSRGSADTVRDVRGFAVKFYTSEGNYDLVGNNIPVFFIRDAIKFPDLVHALKADPVSNYPGSSSKNSRFWDYMSLTPEATHMLTWVFSDMGTIKSYRKMPGAGVNTYKWVNEKGDSKLVKYHWHPLSGEETINRFEAVKLAGEDPDIAKRDLFETLAHGKKVQYELRVQLMSESEDDIDFNPLDATKTWPEKKFPLIPVGILTLTHNPKNAFAESEQAAFSPSFFVPGIEPSNDKLLQGRLFSYPDSNMYRLGKNFQQIPINRPRNLMTNNMQDGPAQYLPNKNSINYSPNTLNENRPHPPHDHYKDYKPKASGSIKRYVIRKDNDYFQAGERFKSMTLKERKVLISNIVDSLSNARRDIQQRMVMHFKKAHKEFGEAVAGGLGINC